MHDVHWGKLRNAPSPLGWGSYVTKRPVPWGGGNYVIAPHPSTRVGILRVIRAADTGSTSSAICIGVVQEALRRITPKLLQCIRHHLDAADTAQNFGEAQYSLGHMYGRYGQYELGNMYWRGAGDVAQDYAQALALHQASARCSAELW
jgi:hypothetical protein